MPKTCLHAKLLSWIRTLLWTMSGSFFGFETSVRSPDIYICLLSEMVFTGLCIQKMFFNFNFENKITDERVYYYSQRSESTHRKISSLIVPDVVHAAVLNVDRAIYKHPSSGSVQVGRVGVPAVQLATYQCSCFPN